MESRSPRQRAQAEALAMAGRGERNERCVLAGVHGPHVLRVRIGGPSQPWRDAPCGGGVTAVDKEAGRKVWDRA